MRAMDRPTADESAARWRAFGESLGTAGGVSAGPVAGALLQGIFQDLDRRYREAHRYYHDWAHVLACLRELEEVRNLSPHPQALELAIWFHDAVYDPGGPDNEERSADLAARAAARLGLHGPLAAETRELILATRHLAARPGGGGQPADGQPGGPSAAEGPPGTCAQDEALILDIDLAIFGKPREVFDRYEEGIRLEYQWVPPESRRRARLGILQSFLDRPAIYHTSYFRRCYEKAARENLRRSVAALKAGAAPPP